MELVVLAFYPPPLVDVGDWALLMFFRLYLGLRVLRDYNEMYANRADLSRSQQNLQVTGSGSAMDVLVRCSSPQSGGTSRSRIGSSSTRWRSSSLPRHPHLHLRVRRPRRRAPRTGRGRRRGARPGRRGLARPDLDDHGGLRRGRAAHGGGQGVRRGGDDHRPARHERSSISVVHSQLALTYQQAYDEGVAARRVAQEGVDRPASVEERGGSTRACGALLPPSAAAAASRRAGARATRGLCAVRERWRRRAAAAATTAAAAD